MEYHTCEKEKHIIDTPSAIVNWLMYVHCSVPWKELFCTETFDIKEGIIQRMIRYQYCDCYIMLSYIVTYDNALLYICCDMLNYIIIHSDMKH